METSHLHNLPVADKLRLVLELWDEIASSDEAIPLSLEVVHEASRRSAELAADPTMAIDENEMWRRVDG